MSFISPFLAKCELLVRLLSPRVKVTIQMWKSVILISAPVNAFDVFKRNITNQDDLYSAGFSPLVVGKPPVAFGVRRQRCPSQSYKRSLVVGSDQPRPEPRG